MKPIEELTRAELDQLGKELGVNIVAPDVWEAIPWTTGQIDALSLRVRTGNDRMIAGLLAIWKMINEGKAEKDIELSFDRLEKAVTRLHHLCLKLEVFGPGECLYIMGGKKVRKCKPPDGTFCFVCPSQRPYWKEEWAEFDKIFSEGEKK